MQRVCDTNSMYHRVEALKAELTQSRLDLSASHALLQQAKQSLADSQQQLEQLKVKEGQAVKVCNIELNFCV